MEKWLGLHNVIIERNVTVWLHYSGSYVGSLGRYFFSKLTETSEHSN